MGVDDKKPRETFIFYRSYYLAAKDLGQEKGWILINMILKRVFENEPIEKTGDPLIDMSLNFVNVLLDRNIKNYENGCKGGAPKGSNIGNQNARKYWDNENKPNSNQKPTKNKGNKNTNENEYDNENVNLIDSPPILLKQNEAHNEPRDYSKDPEDD